MLSYEYASTNRFNVGLEKKISVIKFVSELNIYFKSKTKFKSQYKIKTNLRLNIDSSGETYLCHI